MSKPSSGLFNGTKGDTAYHGDAESVITSRVSGLDLQEHPTSQKQLSKKKRKEINEKIENRTATRDEWKIMEWDKRFAKRRKNGVKTFWKQERNRLERGEAGTRNWTDEQRRAILSGKPPKFKGKTVHGHHAYSAAKYPHLANLGEVIYPATQYEHRMGWHGGSYKKSEPGRRIRPINEF